MSRKDKELNNKYRNLVMAYKTAFSSDAGKIVLEDLKKITFHGRTVISHSGPIDEKRVISDASLQKVMYYIMNKIEADLSKDRPTRVISTKEKEDG